MTSGSWYRRSVWNYKGNREYTKSGYDLANETFNPDDLDVDCTDRHYVITGCNSGIGLEIAREVAKRGGVLHMVCRNFELAKVARSDIITNTGNDKIHLHTLDLSNTRAVAAWARDFTNTHEKIHVLINNAGCMVHERRLNEDGIEINFAVNTMAVHIITMTFLPVMQKNEDARVITVSSAGMLVVRLDPMDLMHENMDPFAGALVYSQNKRQQVVMTLWYAQRFDKVHFSVMHPGWADTPAVRNSLPQFYEMMKGNLRSAGEGADTAVWLAISKAAVRYPSGFFFQDRQPVSTHLPLAWTKTSIEEENLLMQKLMLLMEYIHQKISPEETKADPDNTLEINSLNLANGMKVPYESENIPSDEISPKLSAASLSKSEGIVHDKIDDETSSKIEVQSTTPDDDVSLEEPDSGIEFVETDEAASIINTEAPTPEITSVSEEPMNDSLEPENNEVEETTKDLAAEDEPKSETDTVDLSESEEPQTEESKLEIHADEERKPETLIDEEPKPETLINEPEESEPKTPTDYEEESKPETQQMEKHKDNSLKNTNMEEDKPEEIHPTIPGLRPMSTDGDTNEANDDDKEETKSETLEKSPTHTGSSPTPSLDHTYQSAVSVVEHLIDVTAEKAAAAAPIKS